MKEKLLEKICALSNADLTEAKKLVPFAKIEVAARACIGSPKANFRDALIATSKRDGIAIIAEMKRSSPSEGVIRASLDSERVAQKYESAGAAAISVLTEQYYFDGSLNDLKRASAAVKIPTLRKDFIFDPYQICEAKLAGASAVLIIARILDEKKIRLLLEFAR